jgi:hypothetical protein
MRRTDPISADEYRGFCRGIALAATAPQRMAAAARDAIREAETDRQVETAYGQEEQ